MDVKPTNKWVTFIKTWAAENGVSYREAMRSDACKAAYKAPVPERSPSPLRVELPEALEPPALVRSESEVPRIPLPKKVRVKRRPVLVPT